MSKYHLADPSRRSFVLASAGLPIFLSACAHDSPYAGPSVVLKWNDTALAAVRAGTLPPPLVARALAMMFTAMYDAWAPYNQKAVATQEGGPLRLGVPKDFANLQAVKEKALSYAAFEALKDVYPEQMASLNAAMSALGYDPNAVLPADDPGQLGRDAAKRLLDYRHADGSNQLGDLAAGAYADYTGYKPVNTVTTLSDPNRWQPLKFSNGKAPGYIAPHWGSVKPFALSSGSELRLTVALPQFGTKAFNRQPE
jgi:hypothetical protein